ncbi:MAG: hypothetical protein ACR2LM_10535 [Pyrinomonadaceae bacterium]
MRRRLIVAASVVLALLIAGAAIYKKWIPLLHQSSNDRGTPALQPVVTSVPPFATKEPESYQARRTVTFTESQNKTGAVNETSKTSVLIMRDGERRREEYDTGTSASIVYLENSSSRLVLLPESKLYAELGSEASSVDLGEMPTETTGVSLDYLLHKSPAAARYEKLGAETIGGRATTRYRVKTAETNSTARSETLIWIDEALGMPIKSETMHTDSDHTKRVLMELVDIRTEVDPKLFVLPVDYRKVAASQIFDMIRNAAKGNKPRQEQE